MSALILVKEGRPLVTPLIRVVGPVVGRMNHGYVRVIISYLAKCSKLARKGGVRFLVIYLKACSVVLMQASSAHVLHDLTPLGVRFARGAKGLPSLIPALHRMRIRSGDARILRFWMTLFGVYRVLEFPGTVKLSTITDKGTASALALWSGFTFVPTFVRLLQSHFKGDLVEAGQVQGLGQPTEETEDFLRTLRATPFLLARVGTAARVVVPVVKGRPGRPEDRSPTDPVTAISPLSTNPAAIVLTACAWLSSPLYPVFTDWAKATGNHWLLNRIESWATLEPYVSKEYLGTGQLGRLGFKDEPAGKVRVFAIVDPFTQWLMKPLHDQIFKLLAQIPQDGTFNQLAPLERLMRSVPLGDPIYSYDLSAATDRLPVSLQESLLTAFIGRDSARAWRQLLTDRDYFYYDQQEKQTASVRYAVGQPMGALTSWAMLALTHHLIVQWAAVLAKAVDPGVWFSSYAILGDDVVIADRRVAKMYLALLGSLGVKVGLAKSLVSPTGRGLEFAKRFFNRVTEWRNCSPIPILEFQAAVMSMPALMEFAKKYDLSLAAVLRLVGTGYRGMATISKRIIDQPRRIRNYLLAYYSPMGPAWSSYGDWLSLKSTTSHYAITEAKLLSLGDSVLTTLRTRLLESIERLSPLVQLAKQLSTVYRDREHYGTTPRGADRLAVFQGFFKVLTTPITPLPLRLHNPEVSRVITLSHTETVERAYSAYCQWALMLQKMGLEVPPFEAPEAPLTEEVLPPEYAVDTGPSDPAYTVEKLSKAQGVLDNLRETVYREAFLDVVSQTRDLRTAAEDLSALPTRESVEELLTMISELEATLGSVPLPRELYLRAQETTREFNDSRRLISLWYQAGSHLRTTRTTMSQD